VTRAALGKSIIGALFQRSRSRLPGLCTFYLPFRNKANAECVQYELVKNLTEIDETKASTGPRVTDSPPEKYIQEKRIQGTQKIILFCCFLFIRLNCKLTSDPQTRLFSAEHRTPYRDGMRSCGLRLSPDLCVALRIRKCVRFVLRV
jgi:hypothetical protein